MSALLRLATTTKNPALVTAPGKSSGQGGGRAASEWRSEIESELFDLSSLAALEAAIEIFFHSLQRERETNRSAVRSLLARLLQRCAPTIRRVA